MKLNNDNLEHKIEFRRRYATKSDVVVDLFAGMNSIWSNITVASYTGYDKKYKGVLNNLITDSYKVAPFIDLSKVTIVDVDCYGLPWRMMSLIKKNPSLRNGVRFFLTHIAYPKTERDEAEVFKEARRIFFPSEWLDRVSIEHQLREYTDEYEYYEIHQGIRVKRYFTFIYKKQVG